MHNRYRSAMPSGENTVVDRDVDFLRAAGIEVATFFRSSDEIPEMSFGQRMSAYTSPITGRASSRSFVATLRAERPDVVHLHNPYPLISPSIIDACQQHAIPVVATVHNYRLACVNGFLYRDGAPCTDCEGARAPWRAVVHGCYRGSRAESAVMAVALGRHQRRWHGVARFIAVSPYVAEWLQRMGFPADLVSASPNPVVDQVPPTERGSGFIHAARLSVEKGTELLLDAWAASGLDGRERLVIAGDGPLRPLVEARARASRSVEYLGMRTPAEVANAMRDAAVCVIPSLNDDALASAAEAFVVARPVIATRRGGLRGVVDDSVGWSIDADVDSLVHALRDAADRPSEVDRRGHAARTMYEERFHPDVVMAQRRALYESLVG